MDLRYTIRYPEAESEESQFYFYMKSLRNSNLKCIKRLYLISPKILMQAIRMLKQQFLVMVKDIKKMNPWLVLDL